MLLVVRFELIPFINSRVPPNWTHIDHAISELDKGASLLRQIYASYVLETEVREPLVLGLAKPLDEGVTSEGLAKTVGGQAIFGETEVEERGNEDGGCAELFLLFGKVGATNL